MDRRSRTRTAYVLIDNTGKLGTATTPGAASPSALQQGIEALQKRVTQLDKTNDDLRATAGRQAGEINQLEGELQSAIAQQQREEKAFTAALQQQAILLQTVSGRLPPDRLTPQLVSTGN